MKNCLECGSEKIIPDVRALDNNGAYLKVAVEENPDAVFFKGRNYSDVKAKVCANCGFIGFYAEDPRTLLNAYQKRQKKI